MARRRSLSSQLFRAACVTDDVEAAASGNPRRIVRRVQECCPGPDHRRGRTVAQALGPVMSDRILTYGHKSARPGRQGGWKRLAGNGTRQNISQTPESGVG